MKEVLLSIMLVGVLLLGACGTSTTAPEAEAPSDEQPATTTYTLSISVNPSGAGSVSPSGGEYEEGTQLTLTATLASGYTFDYWDGDASGSATAVSITMDSDKNIVAHFADTNPPVISGVDVYNITESDATINWATDEAATSQVEYGQTNAYGSTTLLDEELVTSHNVTLSSLEAKTTYYFRIKSKDEAGNEVLSDDYTFTTKTTGELLSAILYPAMTIGSYVHQLSFSIFNGSSQTITVTKVEIFDEHSDVSFTMSKSDIAETWGNGQADAGTSLSASISFQIPPSTEEIEGWTVKWYCLDANGVEFTITGACSSL